jgi:hypothetical protein
MEDHFTQLWNYIIGRATGPMSFRVLLQPSIAAFFAIRSGVRDARKGHKPYNWALIYGRRDRGHLLREGWRDVGKLFIVATILDGIYQVIVFHRLNVLSAAVIAAKLALIPYMLFRGLANRIASLCFRSPRAEKSK